MVRLFYFSGLILLCSLCCVTNVKSGEMKPSARSSEFQQHRPNSSERSHFSRPLQTGADYRVQRHGGNVQTVSNQVGPQKPIDSIRSHKINQNGSSTSQRMASSNPITPIDRQKQTNQSKTDSVSRRSPSIWGTLGALLVVISIILVSAKLFKKHHPLASTNLPKEVIEVLGKRPLDARQSIHFVRCGSRILILGSSPAGLEMLSEVSDPVEVDLISGMCRERSQTKGMNTTFFNLFQSAQKKPDLGIQNQVTNQFRQSTKTDQEPPSNASEQEDYPDYDSAVTRLQQKLIHSSRQSLNESAESGHV